MTAAWILAGGFGMVAAVGLVAIGVRLMVLGWQILQDADDALDVWGDGE